MEGTAMMAMQPARRRGRKALTVEERARRQADSALFRAYRMGVEPRISQRGVARLFGVSLSLVKRWETGRAALPTRAKLWAKMEVGN